MDNQFPQVIIVLKWDQQLIYHEIVQFNHKYSTIRSYTYLEIERVKIVGFLINTTERLQKFKYSFWNEFDIMSLSNPFF